MRTCLGSSIRYSAFFIVAKIYQESTEQRHKRRREVQAFKAEAPEACFRSAAGLKACIKLPVLADICVEFRRDFSPLLRRKTPDSSLDLEHSLLRKSQDLRNNAFIALLSCEPSMSAAELRSANSRRNNSRLYRTSANNGIGAMPQ